MGWRWWQAEPKLDGKNVVFGRVIEGIDKLSKAPDPFFLFRKGTNKGNNIKNIHHCIIYCVFLFCAFLPVPVSINDSAKPEVPKALDFTAPGIVSFKKRLAKPQILCK